MKIIPYQELLGNYDLDLAILQGYCIIPYQELLGNYDIELMKGAQYGNYTIPRTIRELRPSGGWCFFT